MAQNKAFAVFRPDLIAALPFWLSLGLVPLTWAAAIYGGWWIAALPLSTWYLFSIIDAFAGLNEANPDPTTDDSQLFWYKLITLIWLPVQTVTLFGIIAYVTTTGHLAVWEMLGLAFAMGVLSGTIGINYSHELMHQSPRVERMMADMLLAMVLYSHFRSEHLLVHHRYVGTPRDPVTARYNEGFHRFFARVIPGCFKSALRAEAAMLARKGKPAWHLQNPFYRYAAWQLGFLALAFAVGGGWGLIMFGLQAFMAVVQLELVNYVEHYGLTRKHLGGGKYEHVLPRHSWNASHRASNWLLINLQRHSDHHYKPNRRFPLLQNYAPGDAPQLPRGYPVMTMIATIPPLWRRRMNPLVRDWRKQHYPEITDWAAYNTGSNPPPK